MDGHRKIDLQSPLDLSFIESKIRESAQSKVAAHVSGSGARKASNPAYKASIDALVDQYVKDTLNLALPSLSINGMDAPAALKADAGDADASFEPYDARLAERLRSLHAELEAETTRVAQLRRDAPAKASELYLQKLREEIKAEDEAYQGARQKAVEVSTGLADVKLQRAQQVRTGLEAARAEVDSLRNVTETLATLERADKAWKEVAQG